MDKRDSSLKTADTTHTGSFCMCVLLLIFQAGPWDKNTYLLYTKLKCNDYAGCIGKTRDNPT